MADRIAEEFCISTRLAVSELLETTKATLDVVALVRAVEATIEFEKTLCGRFRESHASAHDDDMDNDYDIGTPEDEEGAGSGRFDPEAIRQKWKQHLQQMKREAEQRELHILQRQQVEEGEGNAVPTLKFKGIISSCFDPYMDLYIAQEDRNMKQMIDHLLEEETWTVPDEERNKVPFSFCLILFAFNNPF